MQETIIFWKRQQIRSGQTAAMASCSLKDSEPRIKSNRQGKDLASQSPVSKYLRKASRAGPVTVDRFNQGSRSSGKFMVMKQVLGQARRLV